MRFRISYQHNYYTLLKITKNIYFRRYVSTFNQWNVLQNVFFKIKYYYVFIAYQNQELH